MLLAATCFAVWTVVIAKFWVWGSGWSWGPRYMLPVLPLAFVGVAVAADRPRWRAAARGLFAAGVAVTLLGLVVSEDAYRRTTMRLWTADDTGYVRVGSPDGRPQLIDVPRSPEDVLPAFSSIAGHWWLLRVRLAGCDCGLGAEDCACRSHAFETDAVFRSPPWHTRRPDLDPAPPYGVSIVQPILLRSLLSSGG